MRIGELADRTGTSVRSLRYYEERGLLTAQRAASGQRRYGDDAVDRVRLLRRLYNAGLSSATIAALLPCVDTPSDNVTREALQVMGREHARIGDQIAELEATRADLTYLIDAATAFHRDQVDREAVGAGTAPCSSA
ncbi:MerR family transcriptional regulator [uncultured Jatrophihabitans sp.]|uniref:MerR family transcriptional regulator n=1 Tax=uncultured Jatrophihabitans sp. TaxID=1610747 RepID=UPI0035CA1262